MMLQGISAPTPSPGAPYQPTPPPSVGPVVTMVRSPIDPGPAYRVEISMQARARAAMD